MRPPFLCSAVLPNDGNADVVRRPCSDVSERALRGAHPVCHSPAAGPLTSASVRAVGPLPLQPGVLGSEGGGSLARWPRATARRNAVQ